MSTRGRKPAKNHFPVTLPLLEDAWNGTDPESKEKYLSIREKNIYLKKAIEAFVECDTLGNRLPITSFLHMDCDSSFSVVIPRTTFVDCLTRFVHHRLIKNDSGAFIFHGERKEAN